MCARTWFRGFPALLLVAAMIAGWPGGSPPARAADVGPASPAAPVKLVFVHHSVGENWLSDDQGGLGAALGASNYFVSDTNYGWGPDSIGDRTDIPNWMEWFRSPATPTITTDLYAESGQNSGYTRSLADPGGANEVVMFKSCFPNSSLAGNPDDPAAPGSDLTVANAKYTYNQLLTYFATRPDKLFVVVTAPPNSESQYAANARAFNNWLVNTWRTENNYLLNNVVVFDFYNVLTGPDNHHRMYFGFEQHTYVTGMNSAYYRSDEWDDHPNVAGSRKATTEFVPLLNTWYDRWRASTPQNSALAPLAPARAADTRSGQPVGFPLVKAPLAAGATMQVPIAGGFGVPAHASAVSLNITAVRPTGPGHLTVYPCGSSKPNASSLNYAAGAVVANAAVTGLGGGGRVCVYTSTQTDVIVDVNGWLTSRFTPRVPIRAADTRVGQPVAFPAAKVPVAAGTSLAVPVAGSFGVPLTAGAVSINVTAVRPAGAGHLTVYPCGSTKPNASNVNFTAGAVVPNAVLTGTGTGGQVCVYSSADTDVILDVNGWTTGGFLAMVPVRAADTRAGQPVAFPAIKQRLAAGATLQVPIGGSFGVPADASAAALNVTVVRPTGAGHLTIYPCGGIKPNASNLNFVADAVVANAVLSGLGTGGRVCVYTSATTDVVVDVNGWFPD